MRETLPNRPTSLADYLAILRRHWWVIAIPLVVAPIGAFLAARSEAPVYQAASTVYINRTPATSSAIGLYDPSAASDPVRFFQTQADLARRPALIERAVRAAHVSGITPGELAGNSSVSPSSDADLLTFSVQDARPDVAVALANAYASEFAKYQPAQNVQQLNSALKTVDAKLASLRAQGITHGAVFDQLLERESLLAAALTIGGGNVPQVLQPASGAAKIRPRPKRNAMLGLALGAILGIGLAFLREALDRRVWSEDAIEAILALPLLGRLPKPPREFRRNNELVMVSEPGRPAAEAFRKLRTNLEFANLDREHRTIMISSSVEQEGKSTTVGNLGVALARGGRRVAIVDLDLRRPLMHRFFRVTAVPGVTDVVSGRARLADAVREIPIGDKRAQNLLARHALSGNGAAPPKSATLSLLPAGSARFDPGEFILDEGLYSVLGEMRKDWDIVLIDAPPMSVVGDALSLSAGVDAIVVVAKLGLVHPGMLHELARLLEASPTDKLGFVVTGAEHGPVYGYGYGYGHLAARDREGELTRYDD
jgi:Mrp family chromosome partitioning ATPase/capsular polysaccharide biosynthesis protein